MRIATSNIADKFILKFKRLLYVKGPVENGCTRVTAMIMPCSSYDYESYVNRTRPYLDKRQRNFWLCYA